MLERAKALRLNQTEAEQRLWYYLRAHRFMGLKFKRQKSLGNYIVDFICLSPKLIIEIDGSQHTEQADYDHCRDTWLRKQGFSVLRFWNNEVLDETEAVLESIRQTVLTLSPRPLSHLWERGVVVKVGDAGMKTCQAIHHAERRNDIQFFMVLSLAMRALMMREGLTYAGIQSRIKNYYSPSPTCGRGARGEGDLADFLSPLKLACHCISGRIAVHVI